MVVTRLTDSMIGEVLFVAFLTIFVSQDRNFMTHRLSHEAIDAGPSASDKGNLERLELNFDDLPFDLLPYGEYSQGALVGKGTGRGTGVEEEEILYPVVGGCVGVAVDNGVHVVQFISNP